MAERLALFGWTVYPQAWFGCPKVDLLAVRNERYLRIQVKTAMHGRLDLRGLRGGLGTGSKQLNRVWTTVSRDVDAVIAVVPPDVSIASMFRADYYILPSRIVNDGLGQYHLLAHEFQRFRNNWTILDEYQALADLIVVPNEDESEGVRFLPDDGKIVFEVTGRQTGKSEIIMANCARAWKAVYDRFGEDGFISRLCQHLTEATVHGLVHQASWEIASAYHDEMTLLVRRLAWETG